MLIYYENINELTPPPPRPTILGKEVLISDWNVVANAIQYPPALASSRHPWYYY
jgi:hypothetical protein